MLKFASAVVLASTMSTVSAENTHLGNGTMRMKVKKVKSPNGGLASVLRDTNFSLDKGNKSYLFTDLSSFFSTKKSSHT